MVFQDSDKSKNLLKILVADNPDTVCDDTEEEEDTGSDSSRQNLILPEVKKRPSIRIAVRRKSADCT